MKLNCSSQGVAKLLCAVFVLFGCVQMVACKTSEEQMLEKLLSNGAYKSVFTDAKGECDKIAKNILAHKSEFISDLNIVLNADDADLYTIADKKHFLEKDFVPNDLVELVANSHYSLNKAGMYLRSPVEKILVRMADDASKEGIKIMVGSAYRSYNYQKTIYERNVRQMGKEAADRESAAPGTSQHQLGVAIDFGTIDDSFATTKQGKWLASNARKYGFSLSFPENYEDVTGYRWECWHYRYIGVPAVQFQEKWFGDIQQYMIEFIWAWRNLFL